MKSQADRRMAAVIGATCALALAWTSCLPLAQGQEPYEVEVLTSPNGSGPYNAWAVIQTHMQEYSPWLRIAVKETPGFNYNVKFVSRNPDLWPKAIFGSGSVLDWAASSGVKPFYPEPEQAAADFRRIAVMGLSFNVWVTTDANIRGPEDFVGKRVGIGLLTQNEWGMHQRMLLDAWGLTGKLKSLDTLGTFPNIEALLDGRTDVGTLFGLTDAEIKNAVVTAPHRQLEAANRAWQYVSVPEGMIQDYVARSGAPFRVVKYPPNTLPRQPAELVTFGDVLHMAAHESLPDDVAYEIVRVLVVHHADIAKHHAFVKAWNHATLAYGADSNPEIYHPGALKAYKDLGLLK